MGNQMKDTDNTPKIGDINPKGEKIIAVYPGYPISKFIHKKNPIWYLIVRSDGFTNFISLAFSGHEERETIEWFRQYWIPEDQTLGIVLGPVDFWGSANCRSNSLASGGHRAYCTCSTCF